MKQGDIWLADLNPTKGSEQAGFRPVVIISGNLLNTYLPVTIVCPLTTKIKKYKGNLILNPHPENGLESISEVLVFQIRSISRDRLVKKVGNITADELSQIMTGLNEMLRY